MPPKLCEDRRLDAVARSGLVEEKTDATFAALVNIVADVFDVPMTTISLIDQARQIYFEKKGLRADFTARSQSFCAWTVESSKPVVVLDARLDPLWRDNPLVLGEPNIRFYAGVPLYVDGQPVGTLCVLDTKPHGHFTAVELQRLGQYASLAMQMLDMRVLRAQRDKERTRFRRMAETNPDAMFVSDASGHILSWNEGAERLLGYTAVEARRLLVTDLLPRSVRGKPGDVASVLKDLVARTREVDILTRDSCNRRMEMSLSRWSEDGSTFYGAVLRDVSERLEREEALRRLAHCDTLTGLPNRGVMRAHLEAALRHGPVSVLLVDLDGFKDVNDTLGHAAGDEVLKGAAARLRNSVRAVDTVARIGGDEFVIVVAGCADPSVTAEIAERIVCAMENPFLVQDRSVRIGASVGIASAPAQAEGIDDLLLCADLAVYKAKADGRHRHRFYTPSLRAAVSERQRFVHEFHRAIERGEFVLHYQPQIRLKDRALVGAEALIRWQHPEHGLLQPAAFLPALMASRHAIAVNEWVLRTACRQAAAWLPHTASDFRMGVNACAARLHSGEIASVTKDILAETGLAPGNLELEITETVVLAHEGASIAALRTLRAHGIGIAFDDFGTGYASLSLLEDFPLTRLKIDRSFVRKMNDAPDVPVIRAILQLAKGFGLEVVAEGIETEDQLRRLRKKGCAEGQGYLFSRPIPAERFEQDFIHAPSRARRGIRKAA